MEKAIEEAAAARGMRKRGQEKGEASDWYRADWEEIERWEEWISCDGRRRRDREEAARREMKVAKKPIGKFRDGRGILIRYDGHSD
jgi:hypothetical protein